MSLHLKPKTMDIQSTMARLEAKHPGEKEYLQAVYEVLSSIEEVYNSHPEFERAKLIERLGISNMEMITRLIEAALAGQEGCAAHG